MTKRKLSLYLLTLMTVVLLPVCTGTETKTPAPQKTNIEDHFKKFMSVTELEKAGFEHIDSRVFRLIFKGNDLYILNGLDFLIAKFTGNKLKRVFKTQKGQAPKELITPMSFFIYDDDTLAIADYIKSSVLLFDCDLNYTREIKIDNKIKTMARFGEALVATHEYGGEEHAFSILDKDFNIVKTLVEANKKIPAERFRPWNLNKGYFLDDKLVSHSYQLFPEKQCKVDIYNVHTGKLVAMLHWKQPFSPTAKSINERKNMYFIKHVGKYGPYYVVHASHSETLLGSTRYYEFMIFDRNGALKYKSDFSYGIIQTVKDTNDAKLYFMDDDEGISYIDVRNFLQ